MIRFEPAPKPADFAERVEARGQAWLAANSAGRPPDYWSEFKPRLAAAFRNLCAYSAMYEPVSTVDHFVSCDEDRGRSVVSAQDSWSTLGRCSSCGRPSMAELGSVALQVRAAVRKTSGDTAAWVTAYTASGDPKLAAQKVLG